MRAGDLATCLHKKSMIRLLRAQRPPKPLVCCWTGKLFTCIGAKEGNARCYAQVHITSLANVAMLVRGDKDSLSLVCHEQLLGTLSMGARVQN